jgi:hypothetical protein
LANGDFRQTDNRNPAIAKIRVFAAVKSLLLWRRMPVRSITLDNEIPVRQIEVDDIPLECPLSFKWLSDPRQLVRDSDLDRASSRPGHLSESRGASSGACSKTVGKRRLHLADLAAYLARHLDFGLEERMLRSGKQFFICVRACFAAIETCPLIAAAPGDASGLAAPNAYTNHPILLEVGQGSGSESRPTRRRTEAIRVLWPFDMEGLPALFAGFCQHMNVLRLMPNYTKLPGNPGFLGANP